MNNYIDLFNINTTVMPFNAEQLNTVVKTSVTCGFVPCSYSDLISTIKDINSSTEYDVTLNADEIIKNNSDPTKTINVFLQVEGDRVNNVYATHINTTDNICSFDTYSSEFKSALFDLKVKIAKKYLCTYENINRWAIQSSVNISETVVSKLANDFELFTKYIMQTNDLQSFVNSLDKAVIDTYLSNLEKLGEKLLQKYKTEVLTHFKNITKLETTVKIKNPIIVRIYALSNIASMCKRDWPRLNVVSLDRRAFDSLSWYV